MSGWERSAVTIAVFTPAAGALLIALLPRGRDALARALAIAVTGIALGVGLAILPKFDYGSSTSLQFQVDTKWITAIGARFHVGLDGVSLPLFELTLLLSFLCAIYTWRNLPAPGSAKAFLAFSALISVETLSVSRVKSGSPALTCSPDFLCQTETTPLEIDSPTAGIFTCTLMCG